MAGLLVQDCICADFHHLTTYGASLPALLCMFAYVTHSHSRVLYAELQFCVACASECVSAGDALDIPSLYSAPVSSASGAAYIRTGQK